MTKQNQTSTSFDIEELLQKTDDENDIIKRQALENLNKLLPSLAALRAGETETEGNNQNQPVECEIALTFDKILKNINNRDPDFAITYALAKLKDNDHNIRFTAIQFLYAQNDRSHQDHVQQLLTDHHHSIRNIALKYTKEVSAPDILSRVRNNVDDTLCVTLQAIAIVASRQDKKSCETLLEFMGHDNKIVKAKCLYLLAEFYPEEAQPFLEKALLSPDKYTRLCASNAIELQKIWNK